MKHILIFENFLESPSFASGAEHDVFDDPLHTDRVFKKTRYETIEKWYLELLKMDSSIFPEVYDEGKDWISIEKLDTKRAQSEYDILDNWLWSLSPKLDLEEILSENLSQSNLDIISNLVENSTIEIKNIWKRWKACLERYIKIFSVFSDKWKKYMDTLGIEDLRKMRNTSQPGLDLHRDQFGYSGSGNLKILDF